ncbi:alpha/beta hydrolase [Williamsia sp. MIQD14]|uniref:alpha/beta hydrolase n=1 Tax=Williamsia sp. MIQD14 TaxID=3425703 RepID=UPI003DA1B64E
MNLTSGRRIDGDIVERDMDLDGIPGVLWTPVSGSHPAPLILLGHPGGVASMYPRLVARARQAAAIGCAAATIELPGSGDRARVGALDRARTELRETLAAGRVVDAAIIDRLILPLVDTAVPEWQATMDALLALPGLGGPVAWSGGVVAMGVRLAAVDPRIVAAGLFAGSFIPLTAFADARQVHIPVHVLLQWDDEGNDRQAALDLFDAFASEQKTLHASTGGHTGVPAHAAEDATRFFARHLTAGGHSIA